MGDRPRHTDLRAYLPHALLATIWVVGAPFLLLTIVLRIMEPDPSMIVIALLGAVVSIAASTVAAAAWMRTSLSADVSFGELMLWGWFRRKRAEDQLKEGTGLLGLDRSGAPREAPKVPQSEQIEVLRDLNAALEAKDPYTHGHSRRVERHVYHTAMALGLSEHDIEDLRKAAALHDVGKVRVPDRILRKPGELTIEERVILEEHVLVGAWMVSRVGSAQVVEAVRHHHECWNGAGYPDGLMGTDIPLFSRVIAVADAYDAMTSTRPYRAGCGRRDAIAVLKDQAGVQFDPIVVDAFIATLPVPVPVAGLIPLLLVPAGVARKFAVQMKRVGASSLASATGAASAAVVIGAAALAPNLPAQPPTQQPVAASSQASDPGDVVLGERIEREPKDREKKEQSRSITPLKKVSVAPSGGDVEPTVDEPDEPKEEIAPPPAASGNPNDLRDGCADGNAGGGNDERNCGADAAASDQASDQPGKDKPKKNK
jgi:HD-GYP domain-containing protein (c-di-GMP phosphodiesterase class II)